MSSLGNRVFFICITCLLTASCVLGQISLSESSFPSAGDTILYKTNNFPDQRILTAVGTGVIWDYSDMRSPFLSELRFEKNNEVIGGVGGGTSVIEDGKLKYIVNNNMKIVAAESVLIEGKVKTFTEYETLVPSKLKYRDEIYNTSVSEEIFNQKEIPSALKNKLHKILLPLKITTKTITRGDVNASGTLILPWGAEQVLLAKIDITETIECSYKDGDAWMPLNEEQKSFLDLDYNKSRTEYRFYSKGGKLPLMIMKWKPNGGPESIKYQVEEVGYNDIKRASGAKEIVAFPNPTFGETKFEFLNYKAGRYTLEIFAVYGAKLWSQSYSLRENDIISEDFSFLRKGTYLYCIKDSSGAKLLTKRLVIISP